MRLVHDEGKLQETLLSKLSGAGVRDAAFVDGGGLAGVSAAKTMLENRGKSSWTSFRFVEEISMRGVMPTLRSTGELSGWPRKFFKA